MNLETIGLVESYDAASGRGQFVLQTNYREAFGHLAAKVGKGLWRMQWGKYYRRRTTGKHSQNNHLWGHASQIGEETGDTREEVLRTACLDTTGYPYHVSKITGRPSPKSTSEATTIEAAAVIETLHRIADFLNIRLEEGDWNEHQA